MELHYAKTKRLDTSNVFMTWKFIEWEDCKKYQQEGWTKVAKEPADHPFLTNENKKLLDNNQWCLQSNRENLFFAHLEAQEATKAMSREEDLCLNAIKHNKEGVVSNGVKLYGAKWRSEANRERISELKKMIDDWDELAKDNENNKHNLSTSERQDWVDEQQDLVAEEFELLKERI